MATEPPKTPSLGTWLVIAIGVAGIASATIGGSLVDTVTGFVAITCFFIAGSEVTRWLWHIVRPPPGGAADAVPARYRTTPREGEN